MKETHRQRFTWLAVVTAGALAVAGCAAKPKNGECKTSADCAAQEGYGKVCVEGRCQECGADADCQAGFVCRADKCVPKPQCSGDMDCPAGQMCQGERCLARPAGTCGSDRDCSEGTCQDGRCVVPKAEAPAPPPPIPSECMEAANFTIHFDFDKSLLTSDAQATLQRLGDCLKAAPARQVQVQGNCDERGTTQYNLALGERRAEAARKYLADLGIGDVQTVSYGKERPLCREKNEACWSRNRRDDFQIQR
ncbi:MAG TPA: OmpA family protein [Anaeromyxobacter sp.]|nr:OmpA family protein [Anaeromyxobacter sp.]